MRRKVALLTKTGVIALGALFVFLAPRQASATAGINSQISFEGKIVTPAGLNIPDNTYNMEFKIYSGGTATGGGTLVWTEDYLRNNSQGVSFVSGTFQVNLGQYCAFSGGSCQGHTNTAIDWNSHNLYLSLTMGNTNATCTPFASCSPDTEMSPYILFTSTPYSLNSDLLDGLDSTAFGQLASTQTWTGANIFQPTTNVTGLVVKQTSAASPTADIFNIQTANGSSVIQVTGPSANNAGVAIAAVGAQAITITSGAALTFTGAANSTWDLGSGHTLSIQTTNNGAIITGTGLLTVGGSTSLGNNVSFSGTSARQITGPGAGGLTISDSGGALTLTAGAASTWSTTAGTLTVQSASGSAFTASAQGTGQSNFGTVGSGTTVVGNGTGNTQLQGPLYANATGGVLIGNGTVSSTPLLFQLNNSSLDPASEDTNNCSATVNSGAIYYSAATASNSTTTNEVRGCIDGNWTDIVTGDQLGILLFGVVESSGPTNPGDITGISSYLNAPCKVTWASATSVTVAPCTAYSGGRKVVINSAVTVSTPGTAGAIRYQHICLTGTNGSPQATAVSTSETANVPAWNASAPVLCLATVKLGTTPSITNIYDTRVFVTSTKEYVASSVAVAPGWIVIVNSAGDNQVTTTTIANNSPIRGVIAVGNSAGSTTNVNSILVTGGPAYVKSTGTSSVGQSAQTSTTAGYATGAASSKFGNFRDLGIIAGNGNSATCSSFSDCQFSLFVDVIGY